MKTHCRRRAARRSSFLGIVVGVFAALPGCQDGGTAKLSSRCGEHQGASLRELHDNVGEMLCDTQNLTAELVSDGASNHPHDAEHASTIRVPLIITRKEDRTYCFSDDNDERHGLSLRRADATEVFALRAGDPCRTANLDEGEYELSVTHFDPTSDDDSPDVVHTSLTPPAGGAPTSYQVSVNACPGCEIRAPLPYRDSVPDRLRPDVETRSYGFRGNYTGARFVDLRCDVGCELTGTFDNATFAGRVYGRLDLQGSFNGASFGGLNCEANAVGLTLEGTFERSTPPRITGGYAALFESAKTYSGPRISWAWSALLGRIYHTGKSWVPNGSPVGGKGAILVRERTANVLVGGYIGPFINVREWVDEGIPLLQFTDSEVDFPFYYNYAQLKFPHYAIALDHSTLRGKVAIGSTGQPQTPNAGVVARRSRLEEADFVSGEDDPGTAGVRFGQFVLSESTLERVRIGNGSGGRVELFSSHQLNAKDFSLFDTTIGRFQMSESAVDGGVLTALRFDSPPTFADTMLRNVNLTSIAGKDARFERIGFQNVDMSDATLTNATFSGSTDLGLVLERSNLTGVNMTVASPYMGTGKILAAQSSWDGARMTGVVSRGASFAYARMNNFTCDRCQLVGAVMNEASFEGSSFRESFLDGIDLSSANARAVDFSGASLRKARLGGALLNAATFVGAEFENASLARAVLCGANLTGAKAQGTNFAAARVTVAAGCVAEAQGLDTIGKMNADTTCVGGGAGPCTDWRVPVTAFCCDPSRQNNCPLVKRAGFKCTESCDCVGRSCLAGVCQ